MKVKNRKPYRIAISIIAWILSVLSSAFAYSFLSSTSWPIQARVLVGFFLMMVPSTVFFLIIELFQKEG